jgi:branched-chain amino acid transport system permease protein
VPEFWITQSNYIGLYALVALGLVLLTGVAGLTSFGQAAFVGIGAYTTAYLTVKLSGLSPWLALFIGIALTVAAALVLGAITLRMSGHYLPLATIAWGLALYYPWATWSSLGKYDGILGVPTLSSSASTWAPAAGCYVRDLGSSRLLAAWRLRQPARLAPGRAIRSLTAARRWPRPWASPPSATRWHLRARGRAGLHLRLAVRALPAHRQPVALLHGRWASSTCSWWCSAAQPHVWGALLGAAVVKLTEDQLQVLLPKLIGTSGNYESSCSASCSCWC